MVSFPQGPFWLSMLRSVVFSLDRAHGFQHSDYQVSTECCIVFEGTNNKSSHNHRELRLRCAGRAPYNPSKIHFLSRQFHYKLSSTTATKECRKTHPRIFAPSAGCQFHNMQPCARRASRARHALHVEQNATTAVISYA